MIDRQRGQKRVRKRQGVWDRGSRDGGRLCKQSPPSILPSSSSTQPWEMLWRFFTLGSLRLIGWHGPRRPKTSLLGAAASAAWVACAYEVRIQETCWGLSSSFFQVSWGWERAQRGRDVNNSGYGLSLALPGWVSWGVQPRLWTSWSLRPSSYKIHDWAFGFKDKWF